jgi:hypothetical protein
MSASRSPGTACGSRPPPGPDREVRGTGTFGVLRGFIGDMAPGQASGNGLYAFGGPWHEVTIYRMPYRGPAPRR